MPGTIEPKDPETMTMPPVIAMDQHAAEFYVRAAYRGLLGREADPEGLRFFASLIVQSGDPRVALLGIIGGDEYRKRDADAALPARVTAARPRDPRSSRRALRRIGRLLGAPGDAEMDRLNQLVALALGWTAQLSLEVAQPPAAALPVPDAQPALDRLEAQLLRQRMDQTAMASRLLGIEGELARWRAEAEPEPEPELPQSLPDTEPVAPRVSVQSFEDAQLHLSAGPYGRFLTIVPDLVGGAIERGEFWDAHLKPIIERCADSRRSAIDAGAFIGFHTVFLARHFRHVQSFEPQPRCFRLLNANVELNGLRNVQTHNAPLFDRETEMALADADHQQIPLQWQDGEVDYRAIGNAAALAFMPSSQDAAAARRSMTIDMLGLDDVGFIKVDTQGCDLRVLMGGRQTIMACRPVIALEFEKLLAANHGDTLEDFQRFFAECDYELTETAHSGAEQWDYLATPR